MHLRPASDPRSFVAVTLAGALSLYAGCSGNSNATTGTAATSGEGATTASSTSASSTSASSTGGPGGAGGSGTTSSSAGGAGGSGGAGGGWPTCDMPEPGAVQKTIHQLYLDNPAQPTEVWVPGVYVTAVSKGGCQSGVACQIFVQQDLSYADLAAGSQQAVKLFVSANTAQHFTGVQVGQKVDVDGFAWRYNLMGEDELLVQVNLQLRGCAKAVGAGAAQPVTTPLNPLMFTPYDQIGPLLVKVDMVTGTPQAPTQTFGLYIKGVFVDAGVDNVVSLSPFFLPGGAFTGLSSVSTTFVSVTGVFGLFVPQPNPTTRYREIYPRSSADYPTQ
jgi:hypothetical protein